MATAKKQSLVLPNVSELNAFGAKKSNIERLGDCDTFAEQAKLMREMVGDISNIELMGNRVLVGIYIEPAKKGNWYLAKETLKESVYQGVVGLVLKMGKQCFKDDSENKVFFNGQSAKEGDWAVFRSGDAKRTQIRGVDCRLVEDTLIDMIVDDPNMITHERI